MHSGPNNGLLDQPGGGHLTQAATIQGGQMQLPAIYGGPDSIAGAPGVGDMGMVYAQQPVQYVQLPNGTFAVYNGPVVINQMSSQHRSHGHAFQQLEGIAMRQGYYGQVGNSQVHYGNPQASIPPQSFNTRPEQPRR
jgi:hypothetical protein